MTKQNNMLKLVIIFILVVGVLLLFDFFGKFYSYLINFFAISGGVVALFQWHSSIKTRRAEYVNTLFTELNENEKIRQTLYVFYYDEQDWYNKDFHGSDSEPVVDDTLNYLSYICYLRESHLISKNEFEFFKYAVDQSLHSRQVKEYLYNVFFHCQYSKTDLYFKYLFNYGKRNKFFENDFFDPENPKYRVYLDWRKNLRKSN